MPVRDPKAYYQKNKERLKLQGLEDYYRLKKQALDAYGGHCCMCGNSDYRVLEIDHKFNDGAEHRRRDKSAKNLPRWLKNNNYPNGFQILCANCHRIKHTNVNLDRFWNEYF